MHKSAYMNIKDYTDIFRALSDKTRLRIMIVLIQAGQELCVCEIMDSIQESHYNVSRHLRELNIAGLVKERKAGRWVFYSLLEPKEEFQEVILSAVKSIHEEVFIEDLHRLKIRLSLRKKGECVIGLKSSEWEKVIKQVRFKK